MHKRESFSQIMTCEFLSLINHLIKDLNLHFKENEIKTDRETVMQTSSDNCTVKKKKSMYPCAICIWNHILMRQCTNKQDNFQPTQQCSRSSITIFHFENFYLIFFFPKPAGLSSSSFFL